MLKELKIKNHYSSTDDNIAEEFFIPVLKEAISYDRISAFFSARTLAHYAEGLEVFEKKESKFRLIISQNVNQEELDMIMLGNELKGISEDKLKKALQEQLSITEEALISNLAYLIAKGIAEVKIAFKQEGIVHDKFGIFSDAHGNSIYINGSNNETEAALCANSESFDVSVSWFTNEFDQDRIPNQKASFERLWSNRKEGIAVLSLSPALYDILQEHNKGHIIEEPVFLMSNYVIMGLNSDNSGYIQLNINPKDFLNSYEYNYKIRNYISEENQDRLRLREDCNYIIFSKIISVLEDMSTSYGFCFHVTHAMKDYITSQNKLIEERSRIGRSLKTRAPEFQKPFEDFKNTISDLFIRPLRENQMWDAFYMSMMKNSCNFSVPGSGKTASVLGVFAYLLRKHKIRRIAVIGPISSFISWKDEFSNCFGTNILCKCFNIQERNNKRYAVKYETNDCNLLLFNYEGLKSYADELAEIIREDTLLVFDEVHKIKALEGITARTALKIVQNRKDCYTICLTGTPIPNSYLDIYNMLHLLYGPEYDTSFDFSPQMLKNPSEIEINLINAKISPFFCRTNKDDLGVPRPNPDEIVSSVASERENELANILLAKYRNKPLALIIRLLQLESDASMLAERLDKSEFESILDAFDADSIDDIEFKDYSEEAITLINSTGLSTKMKNLENLTEQLYKEKRPAIIWTLFIHSSQNIVKMLNSKGYKAAVITGATKNKDRIIRNFQAGEYDFLVTNPQILAESVSLHRACHDAIYFEYSYNLVHLLQSKDRIHRLGLNEGQYTQYYFLSIEFEKRNGRSYSIDSAIYSRLKLKEQLMLNAIADDKLEQGYTEKEDVEAILKDIGLL